MVLPLTTLLTARTGGAPGGTFAESLNSTPTEAELLPPSIVFPTAEFPTAPEKRSPVLEDALTPAPPLPACPHDYCWHSRKNATQMPASMIVRITVSSSAPAVAPSPQKEQEMVLPVMALPVGAKGVNSVCALFDQKALSSQTPSTASIRLPLTVVRELPERCTPADAPTITLHTPSSGC